MVWLGEKGDDAQSWGDKDSLQQLGEAPGRRGEGSQALAKCRIGGGAVPGSGGGSKVRAGSTWGTSSSPCLCTAPLHLGVGQ